MFALATTAAAQTPALVQATMEVTDLGGNPITSIEAGGDFLLRAIVQDVRQPTPEVSGVFAAYVNVDFDPSVALIEPGTSLDHAPFFNILKSGDLSVPGQITAAGGAGVSLNAPGSDPQLLWSVMIHAEAPGTTTFTPSYFSAPGEEWLLYGLDSVPPFMQDQVEFVGTSLTVVPEPSTFVLASVPGALLAIVAVRRGRAKRRK
ncbi:MAG: hypothetical protein DWQ37_19645 [Planctomycetota bacterium]|nr:MAG: hypothetical protein DWQ37_19645 [Planctomycetota bacterium]